MASPADKCPRLHGARRTCAARYRRRDCATGCAAAARTSRHQAPTHSKEREALHTVPMSPVAGDPSSARTSSPFVAAGNPAASRQQPAPGAGNVWCRSVHPPSRRHLHCRKCVADGSSNGDSPKGRLSPTWPARRRKRSALRDRGRPHTEISPFSPQPRRRPNPPPAVAARARVTTEIGSCVVNFQSISWKHTTLTRKMST